MPLCYKNHNNKKEIHTRCSKNFCLTLRFFSTDTDKIVKGFTKTIDKLEKYADNMDKAVEVTGQVAAATRRTVDAKKGELLNRVDDLETRARDALLSAGERADQLRAEKERALAVVGNLKKILDI